MSSLLDVSTAPLAGGSWSPEQVLATGREQYARRLVTIGAGIGSLAALHTWRLAGVSERDIAVVGPTKRPDETYAYLAKNSQIPEPERLRSDSGSTIDSVWGWPGYALREAVEDRSLTPALQVLVEPLLAEFYTPRAGQVYRSVERETTRLGWDRVRVNGWVTGIRRDTRGGYWVFVDQPGEESIVIAAEHVHIAVGYPGVAFLPDLRAFRSDHPSHAYRVINAYEPHDHIYDELLKTPRTIVVRGSGIVASRVLQRLLDDVEQRGASTTIVHLFRNYVSGRQGRRPWFSRPGGRGLAFQAFNFPKSSWGGQMRDRLEKMSQEERAEFVDRLGGTNTAPRDDWKQQLRRAERSGRYRQVCGTINSIAPANGGIYTHIDQPDGTPLRIESAYALDATGLRADPMEHPIYADVLAHLGARRNAKGRLDVTSNFQISGAESGAGRVYATGAMTLGGPYAGVDSFLGLQYAALKMADEMAAAGGMPRIGAVRSAKGWWRWARNTPYSEEMTT